MAILATLASPEVKVRRQVAQILASIATIEIPRGEWDELIPSLSTNAESAEHRFVLKRDLLLTWMVLQTARSNSCVNVDRCEASS